MGRHLKNLLAIVLIGGFFLFLGCSDPGRVQGAAPNLTYNLERAATGKKSNALIFTYPAGATYLFRLSGSGFNSSVAMDEDLDLTDQVEFTYEAEGDYSVDLDIVQANGTPYLTDSLSWSYSSVIPEDPIVSFTELATNDTAITMLIAGNRTADTTEIWVEGDLGGTHADGGIWEPLSESGLYLLETSAPDGLKSMQVKLRNIYGNESGMVDTSILKKSTPPTGCRAEIDGSGSATTTIQMQLFATNVGPVFYNVFGDIKEVGDFKQFASGETIPVELSGGAGEKHITVQIRDLANNYCDDIEHTVSVSNGYVEEQLQIVGNPLWTVASSVDLLLHFDHFPSQEPIEMKINGDITGTGVNSWVPFASWLSVDLMPGSGEKKIYAQFRDNTGIESFLVSSRVYRDPSVTLNDLGAPSYEVVVSKVRGLQDVTITGCSQVYHLVAYAATYACQVNAASVDVLYRFNDGTSLTKSVTP